MFGGFAHLRNITRNTRFVSIRKSRRIREIQPNRQIFLLMLVLTAAFVVPTLLALIF